MRWAFSAWAAVLLAIGLSTLPTGALAQRGYIAPEAATGYSEKSLAQAKSYMVSAANPLAVEAGVRILQEGGSAVDAAIAVQLVLNLVEPQSSGIGGGAFLLHWDAETKELKSYDGRETAPAAARPDRFLRDGRRHSLR
jgi:gamma-glutamyltransferase 1 (EC:2.3.2.2). Threonine peptidase. MEROPS family T03